MGRMRSGTSPLLAVCILLGKRDLEPGIAPQPAAARQGHLVSLVLLRGIFRCPQYELRGSPWRDWVSARGGVRAVPQENRCAEMRVGGLISMHIVQKRAV